MLKLIAKLIKLLNSETEPGQISLAFGLAMIAGLTPFLSLHNLLVLLLVLLLRVNLSAFLFGLAVFSGLSYILEPLFSLIGISLLGEKSLERIWTGMYNSVFWRMERFNNSIVMGSLIFSLLLFLPLYFMIKTLIKKYRQNLKQWVEKSRLMKFIKASRLYSVYQSVLGD